MARIIPPVVPGLPIPEDLDGPLSAFILALKFDFIPEVPPRFVLSTNLAPEANYGAPSRLLTRLTVERMLNTYTRLARDVQYALDVKAWVVSVQTQGKISTKTILRSTFNKIVVDCDQLIADRLKTMDAIDSNWVRGIYFLPNNNPRKGARLLEQKSRRVRTKKRLREA